MGELSFPEFRRTYAQFSKRSHTPRPVGGPVEVYDKISIFFFRTFGDSCAVFFCSRRTRLTARAPDSRPASTGRASVARFQMCRDGTRSDPRRPSASVAGCHGVCLAGGVYAPTSGCTANGPRGGGGRGRRSRPARRRTGPPLRPRWPRWPTPAGRPSSRRVPAVALPGRLGVATHQPRQRRRLRRRRCRRPRGGRGPLRRRRSGGGPGCGCGQHRRVAVGTGVDVATVSESVGLGVFGTVGACVGVASGAEVGAGVNVGSGVGTGVVVGSGVDAVAGTGVGATVGSGVGCGPTRTVLAPVTGRSCLEKSLTVPVKT